ncbi:MAG: GNAT family N-acetyltransferase [FCB group bacterium]|nr:GNAT family N-acetyltransferase [FCB group bacterium]
MRYIDSLEGVSVPMLAGFFVGWPKPPVAETHLKILRQSDYFLLAVDDESSKVVGFINAISDRIMSAYIPLLEVLPEYKNQGIGSELARRMIDHYRELYMIDLTCNKETQPFYERLGMQKMTMMMIRNFDRQACASGENE